MQTCMFECIDAARSRTFGLERLEADSEISYASATARRTITGREHTEGNVGEREVRIRSDFNDGGHL